jgi:UDP-2-acetamido-3-amino-2,3-dideoxy-glucuronate N-acetyltransferase
MVVGINTKIWHPEKSIILDCVIGDDCTIHGQVWIGNKVVIGNRCKVQAFSFIPEGVTISDDCFIGPHVCFTNDKYPPSLVRETTFIGRGVSIGANCTIVCGITIGDGARIGAGSVVTRNVSPDALVFGNPAK